MDNRSLMTADFYFKNLGKPKSTNGVINGLQLHLSRSLPILMEKFPNGRTHRHETARMSSINQQRLFGKYSSLWRDDDPSHPRPGFRSGFWGEGGIERVHTEAGGWPHLVQLIAETIVDILNDEAGKQVTSSLLERALDQAIVSGQNVLHELLYRESGLPGKWEYLSKFRVRETQPQPDDEAIVRSLRRRLLVEEESSEWRLRVPLMSRWLRKRG